MKRMLVLGISIVVSASILSMDKIESYITSGNTINLDSGKIRLGQVYRETLTTSYEVTFVGDSRPSTSMESNTQSLYSTAYGDLLKTINEANIQRKRNKKEPLSVENVSWTKDATIKLVTQITYQAEFQPRFVLTIDETTMDYVAKAADAKSINEYISGLKSYSEKMVASYEKNNSFIK